MAPETKIFGSLPFRHLKEGKTGISGNKMSTKGELYLIY